MGLPTRFVRRLFYVTAIQVTDENIDAVAIWCGGKVHRGGDAGDKYVKVSKVMKPQNDRQTRAFVGNFVVQSGRYFKIYTATSFDRSFKAAPVSP